MADINFNFVKIWSMRSVLFLGLMFYSLGAISQKEVTRDTVQTMVIVNKDPRLDVLAAKQAEINKRAARLTSSGRVKGYRIQVINTSNRDEANQVKAEMLRRFPEEKSYMLYQAPNFRVRLGNFLKQKDADMLKKLISNLYPQRFIYVVPDVIEYTFKEDEDLDE